MACETWGRSGHCTRCSSAQEARRKAIAAGRQRAAVFAALGDPLDLVPAAAFAGRLQRDPATAARAPAASARGALDVGAAEEHLGQRPLGLDVGRGLGLGDERLGFPGAGAVPVVGVLGDPVGGHRHAAGAGDERGVELVDLTRGVLERTGQIGAVDLGMRSRGRAPWGTPLPALLGAFTVTGHSALPR